MEKQEVVDIMVASMNADNRELCQIVGMSAEETEKNISQSQQSLQMMMGNIYDKLKEANLLA